MDKNKRSITLVTGGTGLAGYNIIFALLKRKRKVKALVRSIEKGRKILPDVVELVQGDITDKSSLTKAMQDCNIVYHAAGYPEQWQKDPGIFHRVNVEGTQNMIDAALKSNIEKFIYTSTIDIFEGRKGKLFDEHLIDPKPKGTFYERSKQEADKKVVEALQKGLPAIFLHPAGIYGPGPAASPGTNDFIKDLKNGKIPMLLPGGLPLVFSRDVGEGHVLAEEKAPIGSRYILSDQCIGLSDLAKTILHILKINKKAPPVMPLRLVKMVSALGELWSGISGKPPLIPKGQLYFMLWGAIPDSSKAQKDLGWKPTKLKQGIHQTGEYLFRS